MMSLISTDLKPNKQPEVKFSSRAPRELQMVFVFKATWFYKIWVEETFPTGLWPWQTLILRRTTAASS